jgi:excisionase family DNA binding protein
MGRETDALDGAAQTSDRLYTATDLMSYLRVSRNTIHRKIAQGMPHERYGALIRFRLSDVVAWLRAQRSKRYAAPKKR